MILEKLELSISIAKSKDFIGILINLFQLLNSVVEQMVQEKLYQCHQTPFKFEFRIYISRSDNLMAGKIEKPYLSLKLNTVVRLI